MWLLSLLSSNFSILLETLWITYSSSIGKILCTPRFRFGDDLVLPASGATPLFYLEELFGPPASAILDFPCFRGVPCSATASTAYFIGGVTSLADFFLKLSANLGVKTCSLMLSRSRFFCAPFPRLGELCPTSMATSCTGTCPPFWPSCNLVSLGSLAIWTKKLPIEGLTVSERVGRLSCLTIDLEF